MFEFIVFDEDAWIQKVILDGGLAGGISGHMPPWRGFLNEKEGAEMVAYLRAMARESGAE